MNAIERSVSKREMSALWVAETRLKKYVSIMVSIKLAPIRVTNMMRAQRTMFPLITKERATGAKELKEKPARTTSCSPKKLSASHPKRYGAMTERTRATRMLTA